jgi:hypothetical protein
LAAPDFPTHHAAGAVTGSHLGSPTSGFAEWQAAVESQAQCPYRYVTGFPRPIGRWPLCVTRRSAYSDHVNNRLQEAQGAP